MNLYETVFIRVTRLTRHKLTSHNHQKKVHLEIDIGETEKGNPISNPKMEREQEIMHYPIFQSGLGIIITILYS